MPNRATRMTEEELNAWVQVDPQAQLVDRDTAIDIAGRLRMDVWRKDDPYWGVEYLVALVPSFHSRHQGWWVEWENPALRTAVTCAECGVSRLVVSRMEAYEQYGWRFTECECGLKEYCSSHVADDVLSRKGTLPYGHWEERDARPSP